MKDDEYGVIVATRKDSRQTSRRTNRRSESGNNTREGENGRKDMHSVRTNPFWL